MTRPQLDRAVWRFVEALYENSDAVLASFQEAQVERRRENAATEARIADLEHTLDEQRTKQENLWLEMASLPKDATSAKTALHNVLNRLDEAIAEGVAKVMTLRARLLPIPDDSQISTFWEYRAQVREGVHTADTVEERRRVIDALNVTVSVNGMAGKPKATLHWWGMDAPLSLDEEVPTNNGSGPSAASGAASEPGNGDTGSFYSNLSILRAKRHSRSPSRT